MIVFFSILFIYFFIFLSIYIRYVSIYLIYRLVLSFLSLLYFIHIWNFLFEKYLINYIHIHEVSQNLISFCSFSFFYLFILRFQISLAFSSIYLQQSTYVLQKKNNISTTLAFTIKIAITSSLYATHKNAIAFGLQHIYRWSEVKIT